MSRIHHTLAALGAAAAAVLVACGGPETPAAVTVSPAAPTLDAIGATRQLTATATDKEGVELTDAIFTWASSAGTVVSVDSAGLVTALATGTSDVSATAAGVSGKASVTVVQAINKVEAASGAQQTGAVGQPLPQQIAVRVRDRLNNAITGASVAFTVSPNGGAVNPPSGTTGADGQLSATWTLGTTTGNFQVSATVTGAAQAATFDAKANPGPANNLAKVSGDDQFGYQGTKLAQLVAVRVRDQYGNGVPSYAVQFSATAGNGAPDSSIAFTDTSGAARSGWVMPSAVDTVTLQAAALSASGSPLLGSPASFTAISHNVRLNSVSPTTLPEGQSAVLTGTGFDAGNTQNAVTIDGVTAAITAASATDLTVTVPTYDCKPPRSVTVQVTVGGIPAAPFPAPLSISTAPLNLAVGQQVIMTDPTQFCVQLAAAGAVEGYLIGVQSTSEAIATLTPISLVGASAGGASAAPVRAPAAPGPARAISPQTAERFERWRRYRAAELEQRAFDRRMFPEIMAVRRAAAAGAMRAAALVGPGVSVGDTIPIRVTTGGGCSNYTAIKTVVRAKGASGIFLEDAANPAGGYSASQFQAFSATYDSKIYPNDSTEFGTPTDRDGNGRFVIVITKEVNKRGPLGFTTSCDLVARDSSTFSGSNDGEFFYLVSPDPNGTVSSAYSVSSAARDLPDLLGHESVHVIQFGRRQAAAAAGFLDTWIAEGQAVIGEEVVGYAVEGRQTGQNYGLGIAINLDDTLSTDWYSTGFAGLGLYFGWDPISTPGIHKHLSTAPWECTWLDSDYGGPCVGGLDPYGPPWSLFRYLNDRFGPGYTGGEAGIHQALIVHPQTGFTALQAVVGVRIDTLLAQWAAMLFADDSVPNAAPELKMSSWNMKDVFYGTYPFAGITVGLRSELRLAPVSLTYSTFTKTANVRAASTYYAIITGGNRPATALKARDAVGGVLAPHMRYWIVRIQ